MTAKRLSVTRGESLNGASSSLCPAPDHSNITLSLIRREVLTSTKGECVSFTKRDACIGVLLRVFSRTARILGEVVKETLIRVHSADRWTEGVHSCLTKTMARAFDKDPDVLRQDMFLITEVLIDKAEEFLPACCRRGYHGIEMEKFVLDVDCVSLARTRLFHTRGRELSGNEVYRCLLSLQKVCTALGIQEKCDKTSSFSQMNLSEVTEVSFFFASSA